MKTIDLYLSIAAASERMLEAARANNWDDLAAAEQECARRVAVLKEHQIDTGAKVDEPDRRRRMHILGRILAHDAEIRNLATPWLGKLEQLLASSSRERRAGNAYRAQFS